MVLLVVLSVVLIGAIAILEEGIVMSILWRWFVVPVTHWPAIGVAEAVGICAIIAMVSYSKSEDDGKKAASQLFLRPLFCLGLGWVALQFIH